LLEDAMGRMTETLPLQRLLVGWVVLCAANLAGAQVFTHKGEAEHFEAVVTADQLVVRERYRGATTIYGDLSCPLGPAVKATILPPGTDGRLCFQFARDKCEYTRFQNGEPIHKEELAGAVQPRMCIAVASAEEAKQLAALVNVGPRPRAQSGIGATGIPAAPAAAAADTSREVRSNAALSDDRRETPSRAPASSQSKGPVTPGPAVTHGYTASGRWVTESFVVGPGGNRRLAERTYAAAYVLDDKPGRPPGRYLYIRNKSNKHLLFYSLGNGPQSKLEPGAETTVMLAHGSAAHGQINQTVTLLWFARN
jgi:hypothetical protein